jgi:hypothetical protein
MARYRALTDLYMPSGDYVQAGESFDAPASWPPPTHGVQPLDSDAMTAYWNVGPRLSDVEPWRAVFTNSARWTGLPVAPATTWWIKVGSGYVLKGSESLGVRPPM